MYDNIVEVRPSRIGLGIFTKGIIPANVPIKEFRGKVFTLDELPQDSSVYLQMGPNLFLGPIGTVNGVDYINHSCNPNCYIHVLGNRAILYSLYVIPANSELTFDYSTTSTDTLDSWKMNCECGYNKCRKVISGWQYVPQDVQDKYNQKGIIPLYISHPTMIRKRIK